MGEGYMNMFSMNNLKMMEIIDINSGEKLGFIKDFKIDSSAHKVVSIVLPSGKSSWFNKNEDLEIPWDSIKKIGVDVILVEANEIILNNKE
ncbi:YlmC/YmxH family sporulation protein [Haloimpatiens sp. FM7330]|uniref:YlmC/YmxH family sporulation protein n=1 Tax=Haloimpatiens sp. FM7330 TaxID=3298610 RepID=UPI0036397645